MQNTYIWKVIPSSQPSVIRSCPKCGGHSEYESTGNFRVNANQSHIDVWLIYQCSKCKSTWNLELLSRVNSNTIKKELYLKYLGNDPELARYYAFDIATHSRNKSVLYYGNINYDIEGDRIALSELKESIRIEIICEYPLDLRLDKLLCRQLGLSREQVKKLSSTGKIDAEGIKDISKAKIKNGMLVNIYL